MATLTVYPSPGTTLSGMTSYTSTGQDLATARTGNGTQNDDTSAAVTAIGYAGDNDTDFYNQNWRFHTLFDTSALTSGATVSAGVISYYVTAKVDQLGGTNGLAVCISNPASDSVLENSDHQTITKTRQMTSDIDFGSISTAAYQDCTLNATGISNISLTAITKFCATSSFDIDVTPTWGIGEESVLAMSTANETGTSQDPKLVVTYTGGATILPFRALLGVGI